MRSVPLLLLGKNNSKANIATMVANIAADLGIEPAQVNVKAKTSERLGHLGRGEGIAADAVCLLQSRQQE